MLLPMASMASPSLYHFYKNHQNARKSSFTPRFIVSQQQSDKPADQICRRYSLSQTHINAEEFRLIGSIKFFQGNRTEKQRISCNRSHPQLQVHFYVLLILTQSAFPNGFCQLEEGVNFCYQSFHLSYHGKLFD